MKSRQMMPKLHLNHDGLAMFLGGIGQARVYALIQEQAGTLHSVVRRYNEHYPPLAYTTIAVYANKLVEKGILSRKPMPGKEHIYTYAATLTEDELIAYCINRVIGKLLEEYPVQLSIACYLRVNPSEAHADV